MNIYFIYRIYFNNIIMKMQIVFFLGDSDKFYYKLFNVKQLDLNIYVYK